MRISDWSSDVCSSDLPRLPRQADEQQREAQARQRPPLPPPGRHPPSSPAYRRKSAKSTCWSFGEAQLSLLPPKKLLNLSSPSSVPSYSFEYTMSFCSMTCRPSIYSRAWTLRSLGSFTTHTVARPDGTDYISTFSFLMRPYT